jgi:competence protein ComEC
MNLRAIHRPMTWESGDVSFQVLHPPAEGPPGIENVRSLVLLLEHQGHHFLFTGDIEKVGLDQVLSQPISSIDVLMSPHHGSVTANPAKLFDWAKPKLVVVNNSESGFSSKMKNDREILTWSTGTAGLITIRSHRSGVVAETFRTGERRVIASGSP